MRGLRRAPKGQRVQKILCQNQAVNVFNQLFDILLCLEKNKITHHSFLAYRVLSETMYVRLLNAILLRKGLFDASQISLRRTKESIHLRGVNLISLDFCS